MKVSIVIPNWNGVEKLKKNLPKVLLVKGVDEFIVSDDASTDLSCQLIETEFPQVKLIKREKNGGFSSNVNNGVKSAIGDLIFLLNSDAVPNENCLQNILPYFKEPKVFSVGFNTGGNWSWAKFENGYFWHYMSTDKKVAHQTLWVSGGSGVFRKKIWDELGGLDEIYNPFYEEDLDLGYRATKRGFINYWEPEAKVEHYKEVGVIAENFSKSKIASVAKRNQLIFIWKNITDQTLFNQHKLSLLKMLITHPKYFQVFISAIFKFSEIENRRKIEIKEAKLTDQDILSKF